MLVWSTSRVVSSSKVAACISQSVPFNGHPSIALWSTDRPQKQATTKATHELLMVVHWWLVSSLIKAIKTVLCPVCVWSINTDRTRKLINSQKSESVLMHKNYYKSEYYPNSSPRNWIYFTIHHTFIDYTT